MKDLQKHDVPESLKYLPDTKMRVNVHTKVTYNTQEPSQSKKH